MEGSIQLSNPPYDPAINSLKLAEKIGLEPKEVDDCLQKLADDRIVRIQGRRFNRNFDFLFTEYALDEFRELKWIEDE